MKIKFIMLNVEAGEEVPVTFDEKQNAMFIASVLKSLTDNGHILSGVEFEEEAV